ncbi:MAG: DUF5989 family protein [Bacteroidota bacterium]|uniref:Uncharacterized protein n=1 Tax=Christiangramia flava JLT2011 TaxID=1229726 RepID=A0A1L7I0D0_9FLAO|nr:DUF5989 family protein [Christiangramia flava]APU67049.1 hypothetical protein GRFL_0325 [Christiangramia flava JLT2011]MEE2770606.1 DUF5989 family protein [Bacteroidota bacterium]OSS38722.1 membrane or secreted protein [Christiangramia flava JLT2011]
MEFVKEFFLFLKERKKWWLLPLILIFIILGAFIFLTNGSALAPFIYSLF